MTRAHLGLVAAWLLAAPLAAQEPPPAAPPAAQQAKPAGPPVPPVELQLEREVFAYPTYQRRNPFKPLIGALAGGPRFEQVRLRGIIWSAEPGRSVALFGIGDVTPGQPAPPKPPPAAGAATPQPAGQPAPAAGQVGPGGAVVVPGAEANPTRRLRVGESWGNMRVLEIQRDQVILQVEEFGLTERKVLELTRRRGPQ